MSLVTEEGRTVEFQKGFRLVWDERARAVLVCPHPHPAVRVHFGNPGRMGDNKLRMNCIRSPQDFVEIATLIGHLTGLAPRMEDHGEDYCTFVFE